LVADKKELYTSDEVIQYGNPLTMTVWAKLSFDVPGIGSGIMFSRCASEEDRSENVSKRHEISLLTT
jgi:hypothetical protein